MVNNSSDSIVFLLTSTSATYHRDALDLMFYPSQISYRFRYDKKWLSQEFKLADGRLSKDEILTLVGKKAMLVHIQTEEKDGQYKILEFLPIREATIQEVKILGEFLWLNFTLGDWIIYHEESIGDKVNEYHELFRSQTPKDSRDTVNQLVFFVKKFGVKTMPDDPTGKDEEVLSNWTLIAGHMSRFGFQAAKRALVFLKLVSIRNVDDGKVLRGKILDSSQRGFEFEADKSYSFDIAEYCGRNIEPFEIELKTQADKIEPILGKAEIRGKYDMLHFIVNCKAAKKDYVSMLLFEPSSGGQDNLVSRALLQVRIKTRKWRNVWLPLLFFGVSTLLTSEQFLSYLAGEAINYGVLTAAVSGTIISTASLFFLRK